MARQTAASTTEAPASAAAPKAEPLTVEIVRNALMRSQKGNEKSAMIQARKVIVRGYAAILNGENAPWASLTVKFSDESQGSFAVFAARFFGIVKADSSITDVIG